MARGDRRRQAARQAAAPSPETALELLQAVRFAVSAQPTADLWAQRVRSSADELQRAFAANAERIRLVEAEIVTLEAELIAAGGIVPPLLPEAEPWQPIVPTSVLRIVEALAMLDPSLMSARAGRTAARELGEMIDRQQRHAGRLEEHAERVRAARQALPGSSALPASWSALGG